MVGIAGDSAADLPSQHGNDAPLGPEQRLLVAVLERAVEDFRVYAMVPTGRGRRIFTDLHAWFDSSASGPCDFEGICEAVGLDPDFIRKGLRRWNGGPQARQGAASWVARTADAAAVGTAYGRSA